MIITLIEAAFLLLLSGAVASLALAHKRHASGWASFTFVTAAGVLLWWAAIRVFAGGIVAQRTLLVLPSVNAGLVLRVDALSALFLAITATIAILTTLYSVHYMDHFRDDTVAKYYPLLQVLFAGIVGVVCVADFLFFLVFWELMTLASFFLVGFERENTAAQHASLKYFVVNQGAALGMLAAGIVVWRTSGSFGFDEMRTGLGVMLQSQPVRAQLVLLLLFAGFATKAGVLPMGSWLPDAYPAAPSSATAAFGGTMTKLGIYGMLRVFLTLLPVSASTTVWGAIIVAFGVGNLFVATLTALQQDDAKRLMSFHVIGQVGYMLLGIGMGLALLRAHPLLAALGLMGGLFHMVNHSLYKSCLFLGAGALEYRTGTRSLAAMPGGLGSFMRATAVCALIASLAIAGVPPLNGFASKWLLYATAILGSRIDWVLAVAAVVALFISLATLASFLKYLGGAFLGVPDPSYRTREVPWTMLAPQLFLAAACVGIGVVPMLVLRYVHMAVTGLPSAAALPSAVTLFGPGSGMTLAENGWALGAWHPLPIAIALAVLGVAVYFGIQRAGGAPVRDVTVWLGGELETQTAVRYQAASFYRPFKEAFHGIYPTVRIPHPRMPAVLHTARELDDWIFEPVVRATRRAAYGVSHMHVGVFQVYFLWIIAGAVGVIALLLLFGGGGP